MTKVVLISQSKLYREGLQGVLNATATISVLEAYGEVEDAVPKVRAKRPDVILLHQRAFAGTDPSPLRLLTQAFPETPVVLLLDQADASDVEAARKEGAAGCLDRHVDASYLADALQLAARGQFVAPPHVRPRRMKQ